MHYWRPCNEHDKQEKAHSCCFRWERGMDSIPEGHVIHHTCFNTHCLNTEHMVLITRNEHMKIHMIGNKRATKLNNKHSINVAQIHPEHGLLKVWSSMAEAQRWGFTEANIAKCCSGERDIHEACWWMKMK